MKPWALLVLLTATTLAGCTDAPQNAPFVGVEDDDFTEQVEKPLVATKETGIIRGLVVDPAIAPVAGVNVSVQGLGLAMNTTRGGAFGWDGIAPGNYVLVADKRGYLPEQTLVRVTAGDARPPLVRIVLTPDLDEAPYSVPYSFNGFMDCGTPAIEPCAAPNQLAALAGLQPVTRDATIFDLEVDRAPEWLQAELVWQGTQPLADYFTFCFQHPGQTTPPPNPNPSDPVGTAIAVAAWVLFGSGASAQWLACRTALSPVVVAMDHNRSIDAEIGARGVQLQVYGGHSDDVPPLPFGAEGLVGLQLQQEFEVFAHAFYNFVPAAGWVFVNDGDATPP